MKCKTCDEEIKNKRANVRTVIMGKKGRQMNSLKRINFGELITSKKVRYFKNIIKRVKLNNKQLREENNEFRKRIKHLDEDIRQTKAELENCRTEIELKDNEIAGHGTSGEVAVAVQEGSD